MSERKPNSKPKKRIWIPKAICIISEYPFYDFFSGILLDLYFTLFHDLRDEKSAQYQNQSFMLEQFVRKLVYGLPPYTKGLTIEYQLMSRYLIENEVFLNNVLTLKIPAEN